MMDERLISEVQKHAIIYNRQKNNMINGDKSANKEMAWTKIALNLGTDRKYFESIAHFGLSIMLYING